MGRVAGKVAFVTGAARGQGRSHALRLAEEGADLICVDVCEDIATIPYRGATEADLQETVELVEKLDRRVLATKADVRDAHALRAAVDAGVSEFGRLDIVVANAGVMGFGPSAGTPDEVWDISYEINLKGVSHTVAAAVPHLIDGGGGSVVITSSSAALLGLQNLGHYGAAKAGLIAMARSYANELAQSWIRFNLICPTAVNTDMLHNEATYRAFRPDLDDPGVEDCREGFLGLNLLPVPWVEPIDISNAVLWLASDESRYVNGVVLPVDAGQSIKV